MRDKEFGSIMQMNGNSIGTASERCPCMENFNYFNGIFCIYSHHFELRINKKSHLSPVITIRRWFSSKWQYLDYSWVIFDIISLYSIIFNTVHPLVQTFVHLYCNFISINGHQFAFQVRTQMFALQWFRQRKSCHCKDGTDPSSLHNQSKMNQKIMTSNNFPGQKQKRVPAAGKKVFLKPQIKSIYVAYLSAPPANWFG